MFAETGFADVSMRKLAKSVEMSAASIYHHFPDKKTLYLETVQFSFADKAVAFSTIWQSSKTAEKKLSMFVFILLRELFLDREFHRLIQRELVDANPERMKMLAEDVFFEEFSFLLSLMKEIAPAKDPHLSAISVLSLCKYHLEMTPIRNFLPEWKPEDEQSEIIAEHIIQLLSKGLGENNR